MIIKGYFFLFLIEPICCIITYVFLFLIETICFDPSSELEETVQMRDHNICFLCRIIKNYPYYHQILPHPQL